MSTLKHRVAEDTTEVDTMRSHTRRSFVRLVRLTSWMCLASPLLAAPARLLADGRITRVWSTPPVRGNAPVTEAK